MKSNAIVSLFLERKDRFGCVGLSAKQADWLSGQLAREQRIDLGRGRHHSLTVQDANGVYYKFAVYPNGAGFIKPFDGDKPQEDQSESSRQYLLDVITKLRAEGNVIAADALEATLK